MLTLLISYSPNLYVVQVALILLFQVFLCGPTDQNWLIYKKQRATRKDNNVVHSLGFHFVRKWCFD